MTDAELESACVEAVRLYEGLPEGFRFKMGREYEAFVEECQNFIFVMKRDRGEIIDLFIQYPLTYRRTCFVATAVA